MKKYILTFLIFAFTLLILASNTVNSSIIENNAEGLFKLNFLENIRNNKKLCYVEVNINAPFKCIRVPGLLYLIESNSGGNILIECKDFTLIQSGDYLKLTIIGWLGICMLPLKNGENAVDKSLCGHAFFVDYDIR